MTTPVEISVISGTVLVRAADITQARVVKGDGSIDTEGVVHCRSTKSIEVECPRGTDVFVGTKSGGVTCKGELGAVRISTISGSVHVESCRSAEVRTISGKVDIGRVDGDCKVRTVSAQVKIVAALTCDLSTKSGTVSVASVRDATVHSASGRAEVCCNAPGIVDIRTISGTIDVRYPRDFSPDVVAKTLHKVDDSLAQGVPKLGVVKVASMSGRVKLHSG